MAILVSNGDGNLTGSGATTWYSVSNTPVISSTQIVENISTDFTDTFTAPNTTNASVGCLIYIDGKRSTSDPLTLTLQENTVDVPGAVGVLSSSFIGNFPDFASTQIGWVYVKWNVPYTYTTTSSNAYRVKVEWTSNAANELAGDGSGNPAFMVVDDRVGSISSKDTLIIADNVTINTGSITLGSAAGPFGDVESGRDVTSAFHVVPSTEKSGSLLIEKNPTEDKTIILSGSMCFHGDTTFGDHTEISSSFKTKFLFHTSGYSSGDVGVYVTATAGLGIYGKTVEIESRYVTGSGTTANPLFISSSILDINDKFIVTAVNGYDETETKYVLTGSFETGYVLSDTEGGTESGLVYSHSGSSSNGYICLLTRNIEFTTDDDTKGLRFIQYSDTDTSFDPFPLSNLKYIQLTNIEDCLFSKHNSEGCSFFNFRDGDSAFNLGIRILGIHRKNIYANCLNQTGGSDELLNLDGDSTQRFIDCFWLQVATSCITLAGVNHRFTRCKFLGIGIDNDVNTGAVGRTNSTSDSIEFFECEFDASRTYYFKTTTSIADCFGIKFVRCKFGQNYVNDRDIVWDNISDSIFFLDALFQNNEIAESTVLTNIQNYSNGSIVKFHQFDQIESNDFWVTPNGYAYHDTGSKFTTGNDSVRFEPEGIMELEFDITQPALQAVSFNGKIQTENFGSSDTVMVELIKFGETDASDSVTFTGEQSSSQNFSLTSPNTDTTDRIARVMFTISSTQPNAKAWIGDFYNAETSLHPIPGLRVWDEGQPAKFMFVPTVSEESIVQKMWERLFTEIYVNPNSSNTGTNYPVGTSTTPVNNWEDAKTISDNTGIKTFFVSGESILPSGSWEGYTFKSNETNVVIHLNGQNLNNSTFNEIVISGSMSGSINIDQGVVNSVSNFDGLASQCGLIGTTTLSTSSISNPVFSYCFSLVPGTDSPVIDFVSGSATKCNIRAYSGGMRFINMNNVSDLTTIEYIAGRLNMDNSDTNGLIVARGVFDLNDGDNNGTTINLDGANFKNVWDNELSGSEGSGSAGNYLYNNLTEQNFITLKDI